MPTSPTGVLCSAASLRSFEALRAMTGDGELSVRQAVEWYGGQLRVLEANRLRRIVT